MSTLQQTRAQPEFLATERFAQAMYPEDRRSSLLPTPEGIGRITRAMVVEQYAKAYRPERGRVTVLGDVTAKDIAPKLDKLMATWNGKGSAAPELAAADGHAGAARDPRQPSGLRADHVLHRQPRHRSPEPGLHPGAGAEPRARRRPLVAALPQHPRGEGLHLRHQQRLLGLAVLQPLPTQTSVRTEVTADALREILKEFADIRTRLVPADELQNAKRALVAGFALGTENPSSALWLATQIKEYGLPADYWDTYPEKIAAVTAADVQRVAQKYIPVDDIVIVAVGDAAQIRASLATFGTLEEWDAEGRRAAAN